MLDTTKLRTPAKDALAFLGETLDRTANLPASTSQIRSAMSEIAKALEIGLQLAHEAGKLQMQDGSPIPTVENVVDFPPAPPPASEGTSPQESPSAPVAEAPSV